MPLCYHDHTVNSNYGEWNVLLWKERRRDSNTWMVKRTPSEWRHQTTEFSLPATNTELVHISKLQAIKILQIKEVWHPSHLWVFILSGCIQVVLLILTTKATLNFLAKNYLLTILTSIGSIINYSKFNVYIVPNKSAAYAFPFGSLLKSCMYSSMLMCRNFPRSFKAIMS